MRKTLSFLLALILLAFPVASLADEYVSDCTPLNNSSDAKINNIELAIEALDGTYVSYGSTFSFNDVVGPRTEKQGYKTAINGRGSKVTGGGVSQVATTLYLALKQLGGDIEFVEKRTYDSKFSDDYVTNGKDAIITDYGAGRDFRFTNNYGDFVIRVWTDYEDVWCSLDVPADGDHAKHTAATASFYIDGNSSLKNNIDLACESIYDTTLTNGDTFSFNDIVGPRTDAYGYKSAINGRGVKVVGGGVAQVASVVWLAVKNRDDIKILEKTTYGDRYNQSYVSNKNDAIITDYSAGTDFRFRYLGDGTMTIYTYVVDDELICELYVE